MKKEKSYNIDSYGGQNISEKSLDFIHNTLTNDIHAKIIPAIQKDGKKSLIIQESNGMMSEIFCAS